MLISLKLAYALIWPLRHRAASSKCYIYGVSLAWIITIFAWAITLLATLDLSSWTVASNCVTVLCLITICVCYLTIQTRLSVRVPVMDATYTKENESQQNAKLSRTVYYDNCISFFWIPSIVVYATHYLCSKCVPLFLLYSFSFG